MSATDQPVSPKQQAATHGLLVKMREAWERGDGTAYASLFTRDARYVSATGTRSIGPEAIATTHQQIFDSLFSATRLGNSYPAELQPVAPGVILIHATGAVLFPGEHEQTVAPNGLLTILATNTNDGWKIASFANTPTGKARNPRFFLRYLRSRLRAFQTESRKAKAHMLRQKQANIARWSK